jgi:hypothetical protein
MLMLPSPSKYPATWAHDSYGGATSLDFIVNYERGSELIIIHPALTMSCAGAFFIGHRNSLIWAGRLAW